jgi:hypothetical protein
MQMLSPATASLQAMPAGDQANLHAATPPQKRPSDAGDGRVGVRSSNAARHRIPADSVSDEAAPSQVIDGL